LWAGAFTDNAGKVSAKPGAAGAEIQLVVLAVQAWINPGAVRRLSAQEPIRFVPPRKVWEQVFDWGVLLFDFGIRLHNTRV